MSALNITTLTYDALKHADAYQQRVATLRKALPTRILSDREALADALREGVAKWYGIQLETKSTGRVVFPADHQHTEAARGALSRLVRAIQGQTSNHKADAPKVRVAAAQRDAFEAFLAACGGDAKRAKAVFAVLTKKV